QFHETGSYEHVLYASHYLHSSYNTLTLNILITQCSLNVYIILRSYFGHFNSLVIRRITNIVIEIRPLSITFDTKFNAINIFYDEINVNYLTHSLYLSIDSYTQTTKI
ncbi:hypothetical protein L9F63_003721, partial [Diploptera punctata]